jgi:hypothetical protein
MSGNIADTLFFFFFGKVNESFAASFDPDEKESQNYLDCRSLVSCLAMRAALLLEDCLCWLGPS